MSLLEKKGVPSLKKNRKKYRKEKKKRDMYRKGPANKLKIYCIIH